MATELATAYISLIPELKGAGKSIAAQLDGVNLDPSGKRMGKQLGDGLADGAREGGKGVSSVLGGIARVAGPILATVGFSQLVGEAALAADATQKFKSTLDFAGLGTPEIEALGKSTRKYADQTVYALSDIQNITAQLAANSVPNYDKLAEAAGNLNAVAGGNAETFKSVGMVLTQTAGAGKLTTENWNQLADAIPGASGKLQEAMLKNGAYTGNFREAMANGEITAEEFNQAIMDLGFDEAAVKAAQSTSTFEGAIGNLQAAFVGGLGDIMAELQPTITGAINAVTPAVEGAFNGILEAVGFVVDNIDKIAPAVAGAVAAFAGLKVAGAVSTGFTMLGGALTAAKGGLVAFRAAALINGPLSALGNSVKMLGGSIATALGGPVGIAIAAIAALAAAFAVAFATNEEFRAGVLSAWGQVKALAAQVWPYIQQAIQTACSVVQSVVQAVWPVIEQIVSSVMTNVQMVATTVWPLIQQAIMGACAIIQQVIQTAWPVIQQVVSAAMSVIQTIVTTVWPVVQAAFQAAGNAIQGVINAVFPFIQTLITSVMNVINAIIGTVLAAIRGDWSGVWNGIKGIASSVWNGIKSVINAGINAAKSVISSVLSAIKGIWDGAWNGLKSFIGETWEGIKTGVSNGIDAVMDFIRDLPGKITGFFSDAGSWLLDAGKNILNGLLDGLKDAWGGITEFVGGIGEWIVSHKGPPSYDAVMLVKNGELIMGGLLDGMARGWGDVEDFVKSRNVALSASYAVSPMASASAPAVSTAAVQRPSQTFVFNQPIKSPDEVARSVRMAERYGFAAAF